MKQLLDTGFKNWSKQEFQDLVSGLEKYEQTNYERLQEVVKSKSVEEVKEYLDMFWVRIEYLSDKDKLKK